MFDKRSNTIRLLAHLASVVVASGEPMWYSGDTSNLAPQVEEAVQEYVDESHSKMVAVIPLAREQHEEKDKDRPDEPTEAPEPVGALIVELIEDNRIPERMRHRVDVVVQHSAAALANSLEHQNLFLMPVWRALGKTRVVFRARHLPKVVAILVAVVALVAALVFVPYEFAPRSEGTLEPVSKREVFARVNGVVEKVLVEHGTEVRKDDVLVRLRNYELQQKHTETAGQRLATEEELRSTQVSMVTSASATPEERMRWASRLPELREKARSLALEEAILREQVKELHVTSPIDGVVTTWKLKDLLETRPVHEGQRLIEVADPGGLWELDLHMPEDRMGHIAQAVNARNAEIRRRLGEVVRQRIREQVPDIADEPLRAEAERQVSELPDDRLRDALLELTAVRDPVTGEIVEPGEDMGLDVSYILATDPGRKHYGKVKEIHYYAEVRGEEGNTVRIKVEIDKNDLRPEHVRQGAAVTAIVVCGKRAVGYVFLHDVFTWVRKMWFRWF
jgi:multidrug efflux pump subunit AcrA (membrane-fusion protein)